MANCAQKITNTCGTTTYAECTKYETELPSFSEITGECPSIEDTTTDIYNLIKDIREQIDLTDLGGDCLTYALDADNRIVVKETLKKIEEKVCQLETQIQALQVFDICEASIEGCNFTFGALADECDNPPTTFKILIQAMLDAINANT